VLERSVTDLPDRPIIRGETEDQVMGAGIPSEASKRGRRSRKRGHVCERAVASFLRSNGYPDAETTRSRLGHDGFHAPGDVVGIPGWIVETKDVKASAWPTWCRQAALEANGGRWVVVRRTRGQTDVGEWLVKYSSPDVPGTILHASFGAFLRLLERDGEGRA
jgi:hypothetical protein